MQENLYNYEDLDNPKNEKFKLAKKRILLKSQAKSEKSALNGRIVGAAGRIFFVQIISEEHFLFNKIIECVKAGTIVSANKKSNIAVVGDFVDVLVAHEADNLITGKIVKVYERETWLSRVEVGKPKEHVMAANADMLLIIMALDEPAFNSRLADRMIIAAEMGGLKAALCLNKIDLGDVSYYNDIIDVYKKLNIPVFLTSAKENVGLEDIKSYLQNSATVFAGPSGVGKSSILNALLGDNVQKVLEISEKSNKGRHTTSFTRIFEIMQGTEIFDTPGIREFALWGIEKEELFLYFHDFDDFYENCKFMPCTHTHEPGCAVKAAVEEGLIHEERYISYLNIFDTLS